MNKTNYRTKQKKAIRDYFLSHQDSHTTAAEIFSYLKKEEIPIGLTTVYRHLEKLCEEGILIRSFIDEDSPACYEYSGHDQEEHRCYHGKCLRCGKIIHLHCDEIPQLAKHISSEHSFQIDMNRTVFYGLCGDCRE